MGLSSYKNPTTITSAGVIAETTNFSTISPGQNVFIPPSGTTNQVVPFQRPILQSPQTIPTGPSEIVPFQRPGVKPQPQIQFPQTPVRAPKLPPRSPLQQAARAAGNVIDDLPPIQLVRGLSQAQNVGQAVQVAKNTASQSILGRMAQAVARAKGKLLGGRAGSVAKVAGPAIGIGSRAIGALNTVGTAVTAFQVGWEIGEYLEPIVVEALQGQGSNEAEAASIQALAEAIAKLELAQQQRVAQPEAQSPVDIDGLGVFTPTAPWSPIIQPPLEPAPIELPPIDPSQDIGIDFGPIQRPSPIPPPEVPIDPIRDPDLNTGKGGVNLNPPIWNKINEIEKKLDNIQFPEIDWSSILAPVLDKLDLIIVAIPPIIEGLQTAIEAPPNIEIPQPNLDPVITAVGTVPPILITAISALIAPLLEGLTAVSAQIANQKLQTAIALPQGVQLAAAMPQSYQMATMIPQALQQAIAIPQATQLATAIPQAVNLAAAISQALTVVQDSAQTDAKLDILQQLNLDQITQLQTQLEALSNQTERLKNLKLQTKKCCDTLEKQLKDLDDKHKNTKAKIDLEAEKNDKRFPEVKKEGTYKCKEEDEPKAYNWAGTTLTGIQGHLDFMLELQKLVVYKLCNFEIGGLIEGQVELKCSEDESPQIIPFQGKGIDGLSSQMLAALDILKRLWVNTCGEEINGGIPLLCPPEDVDLGTIALYQGKGFTGLSNQLVAMQSLQQRLLQEACKKNEPIVIKAHYETWLEEFPVTKSLELSFGQDFPTQRGSIWHLTIPYPKGQFIGEGEFCEYDRWTWDDFDILERKHGKIYCRLDLARSNRYIACYAESEEWGRAFLRQLYATFVDSAIAPPSALDDDGLPYVRITPGKNPKWSPELRITWCVKAVVTDFDQNNKPTKYAVWVPPHDAQPK